MKRNGLTVFMLIIAAVIVIAAVFLYSTEASPIFRRGERFESFGRNVLEVGDSINENRDVRGIILNSYANTAANTEVNYSENLRIILNAILQNIRPGTAGSGLRTTFETANLMDFATESTLSEEEINTVVSDYLSSLSDAARESFVYSMKSIHSMYKRLLTDKQEELLEEAGYLGNGYPWYEEVVSETMNTIFNALDVN